MVDTRGPPSPTLLGSGPHADKHQRSVDTPALAGHKSSSSKGDASAKVETRTHPVLPPHLTVVQRLGNGAYGEVFLCKQERDGSHVAIKWIKDFARDPVFGKRILREIRLLAAMDHPNLLSLTDLLPVPGPAFDDVYIVTPSMSVDLHKAIYSKMKLSDSHAQAFACQILRGLKYLHSAGIVHRDLKPSNILLNRDCTLRIADLGLARGKMRDAEDLTDYVVTRWWRAPELMLFPGGYFEAIDIWSAGCIHAEILTRKPLFPGDNHIDMLRRIADVVGFQQERDLAWLPEKGEARGSAVKLTTKLKLPEKPTKPLEAFLPAASAECKAFLTELLRFNPIQRTSASAAISHPYLLHLSDAQGEKVARQPFPWDFDEFEPTKSALMERVYEECAKLHPEILVRDGRA